jgi:hypothetical protein
MRTIADCGLRIAEFLSRRLQAIKIGASRSEKCPDAPRLSAKGKTAVLSHAFGVRAFRRPSVRHGERKRVFKAVLSEFKAIAFQWLKKTQLGGGNAV